MCHPLRVSSSSSKAKVVVVGSLNIDQVCRVEELPHPGATVRASGYQTHRGGKGANQAISAQRQGCETLLIGSIGDDEAGRSYREHLKESEDIDVSAISLSPFPTGSAFITVEEDTGENTIVIAGGANDTLSRSDVAECRRAIQSAKALLAQLEVPITTVVEAIRLANECKVPVVLNPSPMSFTFPWDDVKIDHAIVNHSEATELLEIQPELTDIEYITQEINVRNIETFIITRGSDTTLVYTAGGDFYEVEPLPVLPIDTVGAGDAFAGCYAAHIAQGSTVEDAVRAANCAGALTTLGGGAQHPVPDRDRVEQHVVQIPKRRQAPRQV